MQPKTRVDSSEGIGSRILRKEDARHLRGRGNFVDDIAMPRLQEVAFLRSFLAHARIRSIDIPAHLAGRAFIAADLEANVKPIRTPSSMPNFKFADYPVLASGKVRMVGEPVAMCFADTRAEAEDLCAQIRVEYEELPAVVDERQALEQASELVHEQFGDNLFLKTRDDVNFEAAAKSADIVVKREFKFARNCVNPLEGKGVLAYWDDRADQLVVYSSTQVPHIIRTGLSLCLGMSEGNIRVIAPDVGGGFGYKTVLQPEEVSISWLARALRRPFRWTEDRREHLIAAANAREHHYFVTAYADKRGKLLALDTEITVNVGAYSSWPVSAGLEAMLARRNFPSNYVLSGYRCVTYSVATNKPPMVPYRGVSKPGLAMALEATLDAVAHTAGREPLDVKRENLIPVDQMPYNTITGLHYDSGDYRTCMQTAAEKIDLAKVRARQRIGEEDGRLIGVGFANYTETTALGTKAFVALGWPLAPGYEQAMLRLTNDGGLEIRVGVQSPGVGLETTLAQIANEILHITLNKINVIHGDTALTPYSTGNYNSRGMVMAGGAVSRNAKLLKQRIERIGAHLLQCKSDQARLVDGFVLGPSGQVSLQEIAATWYLKPDGLPSEVDPSGLEVNVGYKPEVDSGAIGYGTHAVVVAVDPCIGSVEILDYVIVEDCGTIVNPMIVEGQAYGGVAQGIGQALLEEMEHDGAGQPLASTLADYLLPGASEVPRIRIFHMETPSPYTEHGIKGMGEAGTIGAPAAILCAVNDALRPLGVELGRVPITPRRIVGAILQADRQRQSAH